MLLTAEPASQIPTQRTYAAGNGDSALSQIFHFSISKGVWFGFKRLDLAEAWESGALTDSHGLDPSKLLARR